MYIALVYKAVVNPDDDIVDNVIANYEVVEHETSGSSAKGSSVEIVKIPEAMACLEKMTLHTKRQAREESTALQSFYSLLRAIQQRKLECSSHQRLQTLDRWLIWIVNLCFYYF